MIYCFFKQKKTTQNFDSSYKNYTIQQILFLYNETSSNKTKRKQINIYIYIYTYIYNTILYYTIKMQIK